MTKSPPTVSLFSQEKYAAARRETERLSRELDIANADHVALWLEANLGDASLGWLAVRIVEAHEAAHTPAPDTRLPEGMVPWAGGDAAPADWDGGPVLLDGDPDPLEADDIYTWRRGDGEDWVNIIAYTPRTPHPAVEVTEKRADVLAYLESEARRFAGFYPQGSDGRNTFIIFADKIAASASTTEDGV